MGVPNCYYYGFFLIELWVELIGKGLVNPKIHLNRGCVHRIRAIATRIVLVLGWPVPIGLPINKYILELTKRDDITSELLLVKLECHQ